MIEYLIKITYKRNIKKEIVKASISCNDFLTDEKLDKIVINICKILRKIYNSSKIVILETDIKVVE
ncbi:hypothetical protein [Fusobacterium animalis]|uniref:hypothetical protein n=1 Tax=Fusobacterium animalis TaxID=76859 RepID=UPI0030CE27E3